MHAGTYVFIVMDLSRMTNLFSLGVRK